MMPLELKQDDGSLGEDTKQNTTSAKNIETNADNASPEAEGEEEKGGGAFEDEEPSVLERILPPLPASRRGVFLRVEAFSGLEQPFTAKGNKVSAHVFRDGEEVSLKGEHRGSGIDVETENRKHAMLFCFHPLRTQMLLTILCTRTPKSRLRWCFLSKYNRFNSIYRHRH